jgi:hypothetical protein
MFFAGKLWYSQEPSHPASATGWDGLCRVAPMWFIWVSWYQVQDLRFKNVIYCSQPVGSVTIHNLSIIPWHLVFLKRSIDRLLECRPCYDARARSEENGQRQERPLFLYVYRIVGAEAEKPGGIWCVFFQDQVFLHKELVLPSFALLRPLCKTQYNS